MKFSLVILTGLLAAVSSAKPTPKEVDILLDITVQDNTPITVQRNSHLSTTSAHKEVPMTSNFVTKACLMVCWSEEHKCPEGLESAQFGDCWTCCITDS